MASVPEYKWDSAWELVMASVPEYKWDSAWELVMASAPEYKWDSVSANRWPHIRHLV